MRHWRYSRDYTLFLSKCKKRFHVILGSGIGEKYIFGSRPRGAAGIFVHAFLYDPIGKYWFILINTLLVSHAMFTNLVLL